MSLNRKPFFIVGVPRSGTTLTRQLLIAHPAIVMPDEEFQLIPFFLNKYKFKSLNEKQIKEFVSIIGNSPFFYHMKNRFDLITSEYILENSRDLSIANIILTTLTYFSNTKQKNLSDLYYVGDKTPNNLLHLTLLLEFFPDAKFINVVRDPRDVYLSMKKAWGKSLKRAAHQWSHGIDCADKFRVDHPKSLITVKYEDLLLSSRETLVSITEFLRIAFYDDLVNLKENKEKIGDVSGVNGIVKSNMCKFRKRMSAKEQQLMIALIGKPLMNYGYEKKIPDETKVTGKIELAFLAIIDFIVGFLWHIKDKGLIAGVKYRIKQFALR